MNLQDIIATIDWRQIEIPTSQPEHASYDETVAHIQQWAAEIDNYHLSADALITDAGMSPAEASVELLRRGTRHVFYIAGGNPQMCLGMEAMVKLMWLQRRHRKPLSEIDWPAIFNSVPDPKPDEPTNENLLLYLDKLGEHIQGETSRWEQLHTDMEAIEPCKETRLGLSLLFEIFHGKDRLEQEYVDSGLTSTDHDLDFTHGMLLGATLMWIHEHCNRQLDSPSKTD